MKMKIKSYTKSEKGEEEETKLRSEILLLNFTVIRILSNFLETIPSHRVDSC